MADLQDIDWTQQRSRREQILHRRLRVPGQQRAEPPDGEQPYHRGVVDVGARKRSGGIGGVRVPDLEGAARVQAEALSCASKPIRSPAFREGQLQEPVIGRVRIRLARIEDRRDPEPAKDLGESADVILVWMGEDHHVDGATPPREGGPELTQRLVGIRARIDEHAAPGRRHHQDAIALADVEEDEVQSPVRECPQRGYSQDRGHRQ